MAYHGAMSKQLRSATQEKWMIGAMQVLCCTTAFGMGVNPKNVRAVIHFSLPFSLEEYYQQTGRGGRDGLPCRCLLFFSPSDQTCHVQRIFPQHNLHSNPLNTRLQNFQLVMKYGLNRYNCRKEILLHYFDQTFKGKCENQCDLCQSPPVGHEINVTCYISIIGQCVQKLKNDFNRKRLAMRQLANVITGKTNAQIVKNKYNKLPGYACFSYTVEIGEQLLRKLIVEDILREVPPDMRHSSKALYVDLGSNFMASLYNNEKVTLFVMDKGRLNIYYKSYNYKGM